MKINNAYIMKIKLILCAVVIVFSLNTSVAQEKNSILDDHRISISTSILQFFHPYTSVFPVAIEAKAYNDFAFYAEYGIPVKVFDREFENSGKSKWHYYKSRLGVRYYFDPFNPYKRRKRWRKRHKRQLKTYRNYVAVEGFIGSEQFTRKDSYYRLSSLTGGFSSPRINFSHSRVYIQTQGLLFMYGRRYKLGKKMFLGINYGFGRQLINVKHEDIIAAVLPPGTFGFFGNDKVENTEGIRTTGYLKVSVEIGFSVF